MPRGDLGRSGERSCLALLETDMEFRYRAIDERRNQALPPPAAPSTPGSGSADSHSGDDPAESMGNLAMKLWQPDPPLQETTAVDTDELWRQAEKARIRERILKEEAEHWGLELEVRSELREQMLRLSWPMLGRSARGSDTPAELSTGRFAAANSALPVVALEAHTKANTLATAPTKQKSPDHDTAALLAPSSKKQKSTLTCMVCDITANSEKVMQGHLNGKVHKRKVAALPELPAPSSKKQKSTLTCMVCDITANSEKAMQGHLNGKVHKRKVAALPELPKLVTGTEERGLEAGEEEAKSLETLGDYKPAKFMMATAAGELNEVTQMDGYLLCELCNVRTADRITMMCHLQGSKHISNGQKKHQPSSKPSSAATSDIGSADPKKLVLEDFSVPLPHTVRLLEGFLLCELCDVKAPSMNGMRQHLSGKKHKNKADASSDASVNVSTGGKEAAKAQPIDIDTAAISDRAAKVEAAPLEKSLQPKLGDAPLEKSLQLKFGDDSELRVMTVAPPKEDVATGDSAKTAGAEMIINSATSAGAQLNNVSDSDSLTMEVDSVMHPLSWVDGFLVCLSCDAKAPSETIMRSHLAGKKHKRKMTLAARGNSVEAGLVPSAVPQANTAADEEESAPLLATSQTKNTFAMTSMAVGRPAEAHQLDTCIVEPAADCEITKEAEGEHASADGSNGSATQTKESVRTNGTTVLPGKPMKIQVEGKVFTVMQQENGSLSCEVCGVHGCDKDNMILHLYTSTHWGKAILAEKKEKEQACMAAVAMVDKDGEVGSCMASKLRVLVD